MSEPLARLYDLALRALDEQERRADALRGRLAPVLAAAALGASLLSGPLVGGERPATLAGKLALVVAVGGLAVTVVATFRLLIEPWRRPHRLDPARLAAELRRDGMLDDEKAFYTTMLVRIGIESAPDIVATRRLGASFTVMLWGILVMLCGLAFAATIG